MGLKRKIKSIDDYLEKNEIIGNIVYIVLGMVLAVSVYGGLGLMLGTSDPIVVVMSCSMLPVLDRGDLLILEGADVSELNADSFDGDIIVYACPSDGSGCPDGNKLIVHRLIEKKSDGTFVSKGDNNPVADPWAVKPEWVKGRVLYRLPHFGVPKLILSEILTGNIGGLLDFRFSC